MSRGTKRYSRSRRRGGNACAAAASTTVSGGRRRKCCKCKRKCGKTCTCKKNGKCLKRCHCRTRRRGTRRRGTKRRRKCCRCKRKCGKTCTCKGKCLMRCPCCNRRRRTKRRGRRRMRGGTWLNKGTTFKNPVGLNKNVIDPPIPSRNISLNDVKVPGVKVGRYQRGGAAMDILPGYNDLRDIGRSVFTGSKNFYHQLNGDRSEPSPLPDRDQYIKYDKPIRDFPDIGNIHLNAEQQSANYQLGQN